LFKLVSSNLVKQDDAFAFDLLKTDFVNFVCTILTFCCELDGNEDTKMAGITVIYWLTTYSNSVILALCKPENPVLELISLYLSSDQSVDI